VKDSKEFGRHFCSQIHAVEVTAKLKDTKGRWQLKNIFIKIAKKTWFGSVH